MIQVRIQEKEFLSRILIFQDRPSSNTLACGVPTFLTNGIYIFG